ncbi:WbqC family protein [Flavobacteriaceae bacterium TP-CH-4]|uniref:WbqC family protein n=1 Tax=Pelagihabitans pacificus TaxID=2696054 RepID=A0A967AVH4_9FLAO|nr:WbqC family protein [Pelagihabitans pacificus]NHF61146.1 WbqC family protein [Pelagihabitans pacificus]
MKVLLHPAYFPNIATTAVMVQNEAYWEVWDSFQKQTYRNRCHICTDLGRHLLSIPIRHVGGTHGRQLYKDVRIDNSYPWQRQHWRTLETAYRTSPFFEFYEDDLLPLFKTEHEFLLDLNLKTIFLICECLQIAPPLAKTESYQTNPKSYRDARFLVNAKKSIDLSQEPYVQVFGDRHGFVGNTSVLDLLFNEGPNALSYLKAQPTSFLNG